MTRLCPRGVAHLWLRDRYGRRSAIPYGSRGERAAIEQAIAEAQQNAAWMAEQERLGYPLLDEPALVTPEQADELRAWAARDGRTV